MLLQNCGLAGSSHGIGFGEYRNWIELPELGPPPACGMTSRIFTAMSRRTRPLGCTSPIAG